ncbi:hypothetical protein NP233_g3105 [Leucocoprinus birnbaumii]|uniref:Nicotinate phosphoribosyltransferase n=1 Tax=Leucocoprinus birnbaumii TaxID=56174 RepID=A0AAD5VZQ7_9AGAR|nr:hypothetical protein NP233_g3105 [Leucocoprinus birnbaumii]
MLMASALQSPAILRSILDTDLYKLTMQQAVLRHYPSIESKYCLSTRFTDVVFSRQCFNRFCDSLARSRFPDLYLTTSERSWLENVCPWFSCEYLDYLSSFRFKSEHVSTTFVPSTKDPSKGQIELEINGPWVECILWEVPLMALLNETYFSIDDTDWSYDGQKDIAFRKGMDLFDAGCSLFEYGTRRRRSFVTQDLVVQGLVYLAYRYNLAPVGTIAHEWFMAVGAIEGYKHVDEIALRLWEEVYPDCPSLLVALTDTFSSEAFFSEMLPNSKFLESWTGLQQDSGDPFLFAPRVKDSYAQLGIDHRKKTLMYSDSLNTNKALKLREQCDGLGFKNISFAIGTFLTNDFRTRSSQFKEISEALIIVIKLRSIGGMPCVKLSDDPTKNSGDESAVARVKRELGLG